MPQKFVKNTNDDFIVYGLRETYHELGTYDFKIVLNPDRFKNSHECALFMLDSDGTDIRLELNNWGRKINCRFVIDESVSDGIAVVRLLLSQQNESRLHCWVIKP